MKVYKELYKRTGNIVIVTLGENGSTSYDGSNFVHEPSKKVTVADTIGAGDSHVGAVIAGLCMTCKYERYLVICK